MRKFLCIFIAILTLLTVPALAEENLLTNGDFSAGSGRFPDGWTTELWYTDEGVSVLDVEDGGCDGRCIRVSNLSDNDARFAQKVSVEPDTLYRISCMCRAEGISEDGIGATLSVKDTFSYSKSLYDTDGQWQELTVYGRTGEDQTELTLYARVGGYGSLNTGSAWFDDISMEAVTDAPAGAEVLSFDVVSKNSSNEEKTFGAAETDAEPKRNTEAFVLLTALYLLAVLAVVRKTRRSPERKDAFYGRCMAALLAVAFALRAILAVRVRGYYTDVNCFTAWSEHIFSVGAAKFYNSGVWCDYPPGYMLMLWPVAALRSLFGLSTQSSAYLLLLKLWPIAFDLAGAWLLWRRGKERLGARAALMLAAFFALSPAAFTDSAAWGQIDSVFTLMIALCALEAADGRYVPSLTSFALAVLIKPQALLFAPLGLVAVVVFCIREKSARASMSMLKGVLAAVGLLYLAGLIFGFDFSGGVLSGLVRPFGWLWELYRSTMTGYSYITVNALNLYQLPGLNWAATELHPTVTTVAWILFALSYVYCFALCILSRDRRRLPLIGGLLILLIFTFGPMIHERYLYPALLLLPLGYIYARDRRVLISMALVSATLFLNEFLVLQGGMTAANYGHLQSSETWINVIVSALNVANALLLSWTALDVCVLNHVHALSECPVEAESPAARDLRNPPDHRLHLKRADALLMAAVTLIYAVAAFTNLGSMKAPQTMWISQSAGDSVTFDLGDAARFRLTYYGGICDSNFTVELSNDGTNWTEPYYAKYDQGEIFRWIWYAPQDASGSVARAATVPSEDGSAYVAFAGYEGEEYPFQTARYVRLTSAAAGLKLGEVAFLDADGNPQSATVAQAGHDGALLLDEQDTVPVCPSYYNSTYFDEIYHARTAYEHLHGLSTYEWTHPPLGKVLMMVGIQLFGMTPFGWRFMGALMGVLMVPLMYLLTKQLTKSTKLSFTAMFLLSVDSMHFTQTRIATIDSYAVFWIMLMYFFMFRYCQMSWRTKRDFRRSLVTLGLCGVTMGVAWATKWIGFYASAGLAVLFFWTLWRHGRAARSAAAEGSELSRAFTRRMLGTLAFCVAFFVIIPVLIYYFSYYWHLQSYGVQSLKDMFSKTMVDNVIQLQSRIFNYHSGLSGDTHYFRSPWYQWPIIWWPMWYYNGTPYMPDGVISSISCMGNPAVWWFGLAALLFVLIAAAWRRRAPRAFILVLIGFASQFLPWVLVPRSTFIYHYFASVPFIILASVLLLKDVRRRSEDGFRAASIALCTAALVLFIAFYPLESGAPAARSYAMLLRWFKWYNF